jgi:hypothetical protein
VVDEDSIGKDRAAGLREQLDGVSGQIKPYFLFAWIFTAFEFSFVDQSPQPRD